MIQVTALLEYILIVFCSYIPALHACMDFFNFTCYSSLRYVCLHAYLNDLMHDSMYTFHLKHNIELIFDLRGRLHKPGFLLCAQELVTFS